jgi:hypothetical protein
MFKFIVFLILLYLIFRIIRGLLNGLFIISKIQNPQGQEDTNKQNPFIYRTSGREKDISDRARILEEDKNEGESRKLTDFKN